MCCWDSPGTCSAPDYELLFRGCSYVYHIFTIFGFALDVRWRREYFTCYPPSCHCLDLLARSSAIHGSPSVLNFLAGTRWPFRWSFGSIFVPYLSLRRGYEGGGDIIPAILLLATVSTYWSDARLSMCPGERGIIVPAILPAFCHSLVA